jgi:lipopolysaccharide export LptBFGC system permease protein LptF
VLAVLALSLVRRRSAGRLMLTLAACGGCFGYYVLWYLARASVVNGGMPAVIVAWTPNVVIALVAMLVTLTSSRSAKPARQA